MQISLKSIAVKQESALFVEKNSFIITLTNFIKKIFIRHSFTKDIKETQEKFLKKVIKDGKIS